MAPSSGPRAGERTDDAVLTVATADAILNGRPYGDVYAGTAGPPSS